MVLRISEIFHSLEGEGLHMGLPQVFIRLQGCRVGCTWCDTKYTWPEKAKDSAALTEEEVLGRVAAFPCKRVSITGGEPLEQDIRRLVRMLKERGYWVCLETSGQYFEPEVMAAVDFVSCDVKGPSSGVTPNREAIRRVLHECGAKAQFKIVVSGPEDLAFAREWAHLPNLVLQKDCYSKFEFTEEVKRDFPGARYGLQLHKVLWGDRRGV
jgi:7-carboxy-7-deazaguanine synthase